MSANLSLDRPAARLSAAGWVALAMGLGLLALAYRDILATPRAPSSGFEDPVEEWLFHPNGAHPLFVLILSGWLLVRRWPSLQNGATRDAGHPRLAALFLVPASLAFVWGQLADASAEPLLISLILLLPGCGAWLAGSAGIRALLAPALFLLFAFPLPGVLVNTLIYPLQLATADSATAVLNFVGVPAMATGDLISTRDHIFQVIESCSGLRIMIMLALATILYGEIFARSGARIAVLLALAPAVGFGVNLARVISLVLNPYSEFSTVHRLQGMAMVFVGVLLIGALDSLFSAYADRRRDAPTQSKGA